MVNFKYLSNVVLYFLSFSQLEYIFIIGFYYLIQDYFVLVLSYFRDFSYLSFLEKDNLKFVVFIFIFLCSLI